MSASFFLLIVAALFIGLLCLLFFLKGYRSWVYRTFGGIFSVILLFLSFLAIKTSLHSEDFIIKTTNYSKKKGNLYFFEGQACGAIIRYGYPVNANEESRMELNMQLNSIGIIILQTEEDRTYKVPVPENDQGKLDIWEKELQIADECYRHEINAYKREQVFYSVAVGLLLFGLLVLFFYRLYYKSQMEGRENAVLRLFGIK